MIVVHLGKFRFLHLLALAQRARSFFTLLQVTVCCKAALHKILRVYIANAAMRFSQSSEYEPGAVPASDVRLCRLPFQNRPKIPPYQFIIQIKFS